MFLWRQSNQNRERKENEIKSGANDFWAEIIFQFKMLGYLNVSILSQLSYAASFKSYSSLPLTFTVEIVLRQI